MLDVWMRLQMVEKKPALGGLALAACARLFEVHTWRANVRKNDCRIIAGDTVRASVDELASDRGRSLAVDQKAHHARIGACGSSKK